MNGSVLRIDMADISVSGVLFGAAIGLISTLSSTTYLEYLRRLRDENNIASVYAGGVSSSTRLLAKRDFVKQIQERIDEIKCTGALSEVFRVSATRDYSLVLEKNIDKLGLLDAPLPRKILEFYTSLDAIIIDFDSTQEDEVTSCSPQRFSIVYEELRDLLIFTLALGDEIVTEIESRYPKQSWLGSMYARLTGQVHKIG
jgi:hypothetical protein